MTGGPHHAPTDHCQTLHLYFKSSKSSVASIPYLSFRRMSAPDQKEVIEQLTTVFKEIAEQVGAEQFRELARETALTLGPAIRRELAEGKITEDHPGYQALLKAERHNADADRSPAERRSLHDDGD